MFRCAGLGTVLFESGKTKYNLVQRMFRRADLGADLGTVYHLPYKLLNV